MVKFGQHFIKSEGLLREIASHLNISKDDVVLEIGAGDGRLTKYLTGAKKVYAVEIDKHLIPRIEARHLPNVEIINKDILDFEFPNEVNKMIGNLPYEISSPISEKILLFMNLQSKNGLKNVLAVLMYQREFAKRMVALPGTKDYSRLSILVSYYSNCKIIKNISKDAFQPPPKVDSSLVKVVPKNVERDEALFKVAKLLFMHKNKKVLNALMDSRQFLKLRDKSELKVTLANLLGDLAEKKVFYLELEEIREIKEKIRGLL